MTKVVVADDEVFFTKMIKINLERHGDFEVKTVNDPRLIIDTIREVSPDILLLDMIMPGKDGGEVLADMDNDPELKNLPVIIVTALVSDHASPIDDLVNNCDHRTTLAKPVLIGDLIACIKDVLNL